MTITSVLGEPRPLSNPMVRFHGGVDISNCQPSDTVQAIRAGTAKESTACINSGTATLTCIRVLEPDGHAFDYEHIGNITVAFDDPVAVGDTLGTVVTDQVLHLQETIMYGGDRYRVNPLRLFALDFDRVNVPAFSVPNSAYTTPTEVVLIPERDGADGGAQTAPSFPRRNETYFVSGNADVLISGRGGPTAAKRKGLFVVGAKTIPALAGTPELSGISFALIADGGTAISDFRTIYSTRNTDGFTYLATNRKLSGVPGSETADGTWKTCTVPNGAYLICPQIEDWPVGNWRYADCQRVIVDCAPPGMELRNMGGNYFTQATSNTSVTVEGSDAGSGIYAIGLVGVSYSSWHYVNDVATFASNTFPDSGSLADGAYTAYVVDLASNVTSGAFTISTSIPPTPSARSRSDTPEASYVRAGTDLRFLAQDQNVGICMMTHGSQTSTVTFPGSAAATWGPMTGIVQGTHTVTAYNCAGSSNSFSYFYSTAAVDSMQICASSTTELCSTRTPNEETINNGTVTVEIDVGTPCPDHFTERAALTVEGLPANQFDTANCRQWRTIGPPARSVRFQVANTSTVALGAQFSVIGIVKYVNNFGAPLEFSAGALDAGKVVYGTVTVAEVGQTFAVGDSSATLQVPFLGIQVSSSSCVSQFLSGRRQGLAALGECWIPSGSDFLLTSAATMTIAAQDIGGLPAVDTTTLKIYQWGGSSWTLSGLAQLGVGKSTTTGVVISSVSLLRSATFAMLYSVIDASAPTTSWSIEGSSSGFAGITFVSTFSYLVLSSTDPTVNGFVSGLATTYYRIDGLPGDAFAGYSSSLSFLPGTHWVDYYAVDWAGNAEGVKRATITVTAGSVTKLSGDLQVGGNLLVGFLGSGAKAEVVARAEYDYALMVSSVDGRAMLAVDNANFASIGTAPASGRLTLAGVAGDTALALRSGNSTAAVTGAQLAFGYDGTSDLRHALYTQHGAAAYNNKLVFKLWTPATGSSSTLGNLPVLSLEGSSKTAHGALVHVMPVGLAENELVVSNVVGLGLGNVLRWERWQPSAAELKTGIERLGPKDEQAAWADVMALKPARYRRKVPGPDGRLRADPAAPLERGYIFEEIPESVRAGQGGISVDERLVNAELALKAAIRQMNGLEERLRTLKAAKE